jgi:hypothetical protein
MIRNLLKELFPKRDDDAETATCGECGAVVSKTRMIYRDGYGWFCNAKEYLDHWYSTII